MKTTPNQTRKTHTSSRLLLLGLLWSAVFLPPPALLAQGTAFTYQGRLDDNGAPAGGIYDLRFTIYDAPTNGNVVGNPLTNAATAVSNGLFTVQLDFGAGVFEGQSRWLDIGVATNGGGGFTTLMPRQPLMPAPYAIFANSASNLLGALPTAQLSGSVSNSQLANSSITVTAGVGLGGGGPAALGGATTLSNAGVISLAGGGGVTVSAATGAVTLGSTATSADTANTIVSRDASGNFSAGSVTLAGTLNLPAAPAIINSGGSRLLLSEGAQNLFLGLQAGNATVSGSENTGVGYGALEDDANGYQNTAVGYYALISNTSGYQNTAAGNDALALNSSGAENTALGFWALAQNSTGNYNTAAGYYALTDNTSGSDNTALGNGAMVNNLTGADNTAVGYHALQNTASSQNSAVGSWALNADSSGADNTAFGYYALLENTSGAGNTADGYYALTQNNGTNNIALGYYAGYNITTGSSNIDIGNTGVAGDENLIRIGSGQTTAYIAGVLTGNGSGLTGLNAAQMTNGTLSEAVLPADVARLGVNQTFTGLNTFMADVLVADNVGIGTASPATRLHVVSASGDCEVSVQSGDPGGHRWTIQSSANTGAPHLSASFQIIDRTANVSRLLIDTNGNVGIGNSGPTSLLTVGTGGAYCNGTTWVNGSDRNAKKDFSPVNPREVLAKVAALPITEWQYKVDGPGIEHLGPMAQDFHAAFGLNGADDTHIATVDEGGVALAAVQGLNERVESEKREAETQIEALKTENADLKARLEKLEQLINAKKGDTP
ncbi:MAG: tail fiber domain-containing protein [Verrucomicrobiota bacterium]|nr:tail fiber domain-containing protein [Verrucomicrobiota bacterium]